LLFCVHKSKEVGAVFLNLFSGPGKGRGKDSREEERERNDKAAMGNCQYVLQRTPDYRTLLHMADTRNKLGNTEEFINNLTRATRLK